MIITEHWESTRRPGQWYWYAHDTETGDVTRGYAADEWLAKAHARVAAKKYAATKEQTP